MLIVNRPCFLLIPNERNKRLLAPGTVQQLAGMDVTAQFEEPINLDPGTDATIFAEVRGKFFQQAITINTILVSEETPEPTVTFSCLGEPVSAESRGSYRVSVAACNLYARVANNDSCHVVDVSPEGCAVISPRAMTVGSAVEIFFEHEGILVVGTMRVQTAMETKTGKLRYGLYAFEKKTPLRAGLERMSIALQRLQLKRLAGAA